MTTTVPVPNGFGEAGFLLSFPLPTNFFEVCEQQYDDETSACDDQDQLVACPTFALAVSATMEAANPSSLEVHGAELVFYANCDDALHDRDNVKVPVGDVVSAAELDDRCDEIEQLLDFEFTSESRASFERLVRSKEWDTILASNVAPEVIRALQPTLSLEWEAAR